MLIFHQNMRLSVQAAFMMILVILTLLPQYETLFAQDVTVKASLSTRMVYENEPFRYTITVEGKADFDRAKVNTGEDFQLLSNRTSTSENFSIINGKVYRAKSLTYTLVPKKSGKLTILPAKVTMKNGETHLTNALQVSVMKGSQSPQVGSGAPPSSKDFLKVPKDQIFIKPVVSKKNLYVGQGATVTYKLYYRVKITRYEQVEDIKPEGFWKEEFEVDQQIASQNEYLNGTLYRVATIKKFQVFPTRAGKLEISPYRALCEVLMTDVLRNKWGLSMNFNQFFNSMGKTMKAEVYAPAIQFRVKPLPDPKPESFLGAVGKFKLSASLDRDSVKTGSPVTFKFNISGEGNISTLPVLDIELPSEFEKYDPKVSQEVLNKGTKIRGSKSVEIVAIPRASGNYELGRVLFSYFDPVKKTYKTLKSPEFEIFVEPSPEERSSGFANKQAITRFGSDIHFLKTSAGTLSLFSVPLYKSVWFYSSFLVPALAFFLFVLQKQKVDKMQGDKAYARRYVATPEARKHLKKAKALLKDRKEKAFFAELESALLKYIGNKFNVDERAMTKPELKDLLLSKKLSEETIERFINVLETAEAYRFAPTTHSQQSLDGYYDMAEKTISEISKL